jgi:uncharacterized membrane protein
MKTLRIISDSGSTIPLLTLMCASGLGLVLIGLRILYSGNWHQLYLIWNLILAWLPLLFSVIACRFGQPGCIRNWRFVGSSLAWLAFFPNAPYIFTDLIHLHAPDHGRFWVDLVLILLFAWNGFLLGFVSLYLMQSVVTRLWGKAAGWTLVPVIAGLSGLGVCMGHFLRWNSWDILLNPIGICHDLGERAADMFANPGKIVLPSLFALFLLMSYLMLYALTHLPRLGHSISSETSH